MIGNDLAHTWKNDPGTGAGNNSQAIVIHFKGNCFGDKFWDLPEMEEIKKLLEKSKSGLKILEPASSTIKEIIQHIVSEKGSGRLIGLLSILELLANSQNIEILSSPGFINSLSNNDSDRINIAYQYIMKNFRSKISLAEVAKMVNMSRSAFSRFFSYRTRKSFSQFVIELKVGHACKLLLKDNMAITQICTECGFNNTSNFNKQFKKITNTTPKKFQQSFFLERC